MDLARQPAGRRPLGGPYPRLVRVPMTGEVRPDGPGGRGGRLWVWGNRYAAAAWSFNRLCVKVMSDHSARTFARIADLILAILGWAAEMELLTRRERISARRELAEAPGRPSRLSAAERRGIRRPAAARESVRAHRDGAEGAEVDRGPDANVSAVPKSSPQVQGPER